MDSDRITDLSLAVRPGAADHRIAGQRAGVNRWSNRREDNPGPCKPLEPDEDVISFSETGINDGSVVGVTQLWGDRLFK